MLWMSYDAVVSGSIVFASLRGECSHVGKRVVARWGRADDRQSRAGGAIDALEESERMLEDDEMYRGGSGKFWWQATIRQMNGRWARREAADGWVKREMPPPTFDTPSLRVATTNLSALWKLHKDV